MQSEQVTREYPKILSPGLRRLLTAARLMASIDGLRSLALMNLAPMVTTGSGVFTLSGRSAKFVRRNPHSVSCATCEVGLDKITARNTDRESIRTNCAWTSASN